MLCERPPKGFEKYFPGPKKTQQKEAGEQTRDKPSGKGKKHAGSIKQNSVLKLLVPKANC